MMGEGGERRENEKKNWFLHEIYKREDQRNFQGEG